MHVTERTFTVEQPLRDGKRQACQEVADAGLAGANAVDDARLSLLPMSKSPSITFCSVSGMSKWLPRMSPMLKRSYERCRRACRSAKPRPSIA